MKKIHRLLIIPMGVCILGLSEYTPHSPKKEVNNRPTLSEKKLSSSQAIKKWNDLRDESIQAYQAKKYSIAEMLSEMALDLAKKQWGLLHVKTITSTANLAVAHFKQKHYKKAERLFIDVVNLKKEVLGKRHSSTLNSMNNLAQSYQAQGDYEQAEPLLVETLALTKEVEGKRHPHTLTSMNNLASLYQTQGRYEQAEPLLVETLALMKEVLGKQHPDTLTCMGHLALLYQAKGLYEQAEPLFVEILVLRKEVLGKRHSSTVTSMNNLALLYQVQGRYKKAELLYVKTLALKKEVLGKQHPDTLTSVGNLAGLYQVQGHYEKAEPLFVETLAFRKEVQGKRHPHTLINMGNLAHLYKAQGRYEQAEPIFVETLALTKEVQGKRHPDTLISMGNLAQLYIAQGRYEQAEPLLVETLAVFKEMLGWQLHTLASMNNLASLYQRQGRYEKAGPLFVESLSLIKKVLGKRHPNTLISMGNLAQSYQAQGRYEKAEPLYIETLALGKKVLGEWHPNTLVSMTNLASLYQENEQWKQAKTLFDKSLLYRNQFLQQVLWGAGEKTRSSYLQQQEGNKNNYLSFYSHLIMHEAKESNKAKDSSIFKPSQLAQQAWKISISRKGLLLRIASEASALSKLHQNDDPKLAKISQQIKETRSQISALTFSTKPNPSQQTKLEDQLNTLQRQLSNKVSSFRDKNKIIEPEHILSALSKQQAVVDFLVYKEMDLKTLQNKTEQLIAFVANPETGVHFIKLGELAPITKLIQTYRKAIEYNPNNPSWFTSKDRKQSLIKTSQALYKKLWQPLSSALANKKQIYLIPDGALHLLPFKALQNEQGEYLAQQVELTRLGSARDIVLPKQASSSNTSTIMANPVYSAKTDETKQQKRTISRQLRNLSFSPLPGTKKESENIYKTLQQLKHPVNLYTQEQASEAAIKKEKSPRLLHIATHGFFLEKLEIPEDKNLTRDIQLNQRGKLAIAYIENPLARSGLAFSYANQGLKGKKQADGTDGVLTALEVVDLNLEGTELVTLSACETGVGEISVGEGVYSLNRAFQEAGAKAVLSTLWSISDEGTNQFMQKFYHRFLNKQSAQQALRETQEEFKNSEHWNDPFYWSAFVVTGL